MAASFFLMKLATYKDGSRDGQLVVVSRDLRFAHYATGIASRMQQVLDDWVFIAPQLQDLYHELNTGRAPHAFAFDSTQCMAPLPRAFDWAEGQAYGAHTLLTEPDSAPSRTEPCVRQGAGDALVGACDEVAVPSAALGVDFGAGWAVIAGDMALGSTPEQALASIRLVLLKNTMHLRNVPADSVNSVVATAFSPVAVTVEELGDAWKHGRIHLPLHCSWNGRKVGMCDTGEDMNFHMGQVLAHLSKTRRIDSGALVSVGIVCNAGAESGRGKDRRMDWPKGYASIIQKRAMETALQGVPSTGYLQFGDSVRVEMKNKEGHSIFGAIDQTLISPQGDGSAS